MRFSIITPSFNQARFLPDNLQSVAAQEAVEVEHVVVDPGSTDGATELARAAPGVTLIAAPDHGQSHGITKGFAQSHGEILTWLSPDDFYPDARVLARVAETFRQHPEADIVYGNVDVVGEDGQFLRKGLVNARAETLPASFHSQVGIVQPGVFMRRRVFDRIGGPSEDYEYCMDYEYWVRMAAAGLTWVHVDAVLAHHRWRDGMKTASDHDRSLIEHFRVCTRYFGYIHWKWLDRYAEFCATAADGVVNHAAAIDPAEKRRGARAAIRRFVTRDMLALLEGSALPDHEATLAYILDHAPDLRRSLHEAAAAPPATRPSIRFHPADGPDPARPLPAEPEALRAALAEGQDLLLVWDDPRDRIAAAIAAGLDPAPVLAGWAAEAAAALACYRPLRARVRVAAAAHAGEAVATRNTDPAKAKPPYPAAQGPDPVPDPALWPLAELWLRRNRTAQRLLAELEASGPTPGDMETAPDRLVRAAAAIRQSEGLHRQLAQTRTEARTASGELAGQREARAEAEARAARLDKEAAELRDSLRAADAAAADLRRQFDQSRAEAESTADELAGQREARAEAEARAARLEKEAAELRDSLGSADAAAADLRRQLDQSRAEAETRAARLEKEAAAGQSLLTEARTALGDALQAVEASRRKAADLAADRDRDRQTLAALRAEAAAEAARAAEALRAARAEIDRFYSSRSWRLTAPLRGVRRLFGPGKGTPP